MKRFIPGSIATAILMGTLAMTQIAEAKNPIERRLRPGQGFWNNNTASQTRSYSNSGTRYYAPQQTTPQQYVMPQQTVPQQYAAPQRYYYYPQQRTYVVQPSVTVPSRSVVTTPAKPAETPVKVETPAQIER